MNYLLNTSTDPYFNMAFDSYVLENTDFEGVYLWQNAPSVILGLNQSIYAEVNLPYLHEHGILPVRRVSGGGAQRRAATGATRLPQGSPARPCESASSTRPNSALPQ